METFPFSIGVWVGEEGLWGLGWGGRFIGVVQSGTGFLGDCCPFLEAAKCLLSFPGGLWKIVAEAEDAWDGSLLLLGIRGSTKFCCTYALVGV